MKNLVQYFFAMALCTNLLVAQVQNTYPTTSTQIFENIQKLNVLGSVMYIAAHPDDENTRLIAYMANNQKVRTSYLSLTRGDGGQNLIGPELSALLGVIRTEELLAARRTDGGEQRFTRANDFGFSKHPDETFEIWDKQQVLSDVVLAIRQFKPDVIINRFDHRTAGNTHGHHTASAILSVDAFELAANSTAFPEQLKTLSTWQTKRIFFNPSYWFYGSQEKFDKVDKSKFVSFDVGVYYPLKGESNNEIASKASSQHLSQGFGRLSQRGEQKEYLEFLKGNAITDYSSVFSGIDISWRRIKGGQEIAKILEPIEAHFNFKNPSQQLPELLKAYQLIQKIDDTYWKKIKSEALENIITQCAGLFLEATANAPYSSPNSTIELAIEVLNRNAKNVLLNSLTIGHETISKNIALQNNSPFTLTHNYKIPITEPYTAPYWLNKKGSIGMYVVEDENLIGLPETPKHCTVTYNLTIDKTPLSITKPVIYRYAKPDVGEIYRPFEIIPEVALKISEKVIIFNADEAKTVNITVKAFADNLNGYVQIEHPDNWQITPEKQAFSISKKGDTQDVTFTITPPNTESEITITPKAYIGQTSYSKNLIEIDYKHIPFQSVLLPCESKLVKLDIKKIGQNIAYIEGAGDAVPESLKQIGYHVQILDPKTISAENLNKFDAIVVGIRAYNTVDALALKQTALLNYVQAGGTLIVQYNTVNGLKTKQLAPYPLTLSNDRVTNENAEVLFLNPTHEILNYPNKITAADFKNWVQERGLYFPNSWDSAFTPILSMHDKGETAKTGSLLVTKYGKGYYIYTGLSFFRELPEGVPGAYRLFANMLSIGKTKMLKTNIKSKNDRK